MKYLLDTNVISELRDADRCDASVRAWAAVQDVLDYGVSVITLMELERGALAVRNRDPVFSVKLMRWLGEMVRPHYAGRILIVDEAIASRCAALFQMKTPSLADALIAATALAHDLTVVTRNTADFEPMGVRLFNPWEA